MSELSKEYNFKQVEEKWERSWDSSIYYFDWESKKPQYIIDTPPPYPTGNFHIGNALNWCYIDFAARYKRMRGYNVMFPIGFACAIMGVAARAAHPEMKATLALPYMIMSLDPVISGLTLAYSWSL